MPPLPLILEAIFQKFLPVAGAAALLYSLVLFCCGARLRGLGVWLALVGAWCVTNMSFDSWQGLLRWLPWEEGAKPIDWVPWMMLLAVSVGAVTELIPSWIARLILWLGVVAAATWLLTPPVIRDQEKAMLAAVAGVAGLNLFAGWGVARRHPGGLVPLVQSIAWIGCAMVLIYANSAKMMDVSMALGAGLIGVALIAAQTRTDAGTATAAMGVLLPGLMLIGWQGTSSDLPKDAFIAAAAAPAAMILTFPLPQKRFGWILPLVMISLPVGWALMRAMQYGSLAV